MIYAQLIDKVQKRYGFEYLGFCGRDTYYIYLLYKKLKNDENETPAASDYLYYSRKLVHTSEDELIKYFSSKINNRKALMIDFDGTGTHLHKLRKDGNFNYTMLLCGGGGARKGDAPVAMYSFKERPTNWISFIKQPQEFVDGETDIYFTSGRDGGPKLVGSHIVEALNRATHNTPVKLKTVQIGNKIVPHVIFNEVSDIENLDVLTACLQEILNSPAKWGGDRRRKYC